MPNFPSDSTLKRIDKKLRSGAFSATLPPGASAQDKFKYDICKKILTFMKDHDLSQRELAKRLEIHESRVSEIVHYKITKVTVDRLMSHLERLKINVSYKLVA